MKPHEHPGWAAEHRATEVTRFSWPVTLWGLRAEARGFLRVGELFVALEPKPSGLSEFVDPSWPMSRSPSVAPSPVVPSWPMSRSPSVAQEPVSLRRRETEASLAVGPRPSVRLQRASPLRPSGRWRSGPKEPKPHGAGQPCPDDVRLPDRSLARVRRVRGYERSPWSSRSDRLDGPKPKLRSTRFLRFMPSTEVECPNQLRGVSRVRQSPQTPTVVPPTE